MVQHDLLHLDWAHYWEQFLSLSEVLPVSSDKQKYEEESLWNEVMKKQYRL